MLYTGINMTSTRRSSVINKEHGKLRTNSRAGRKDRSFNKSLGKSTGLSGKMCQPCLHPDAMEEDDDDEYKEEV